MRGFCTTCWLEALLGLVTRAIINEDGNIRTCESRVEAVGFVLHTLAQGLLHRLCSSSLRTLTRMACCVPG